MSNRAIERAHKKSIELANTYNVSSSCIVWMGGNKFIIVKDGKEIVVSA